MKTWISLLLVIALASPAYGQTSNDEIARRVDAITPRVVEWRRDIHAHPELANQETRTARLVARQMRRLGLEVREGIAHTGVIGILRGARPGPTVALRADMDALPVLEQTGLPFASRVTAPYGGQTMPVAHACGHDAHVAMLMGAAEVLASMRDDLAGTIVFIFQPAEEGAPGNERWGAALMVEEGALNNPRPDAIFGLHVGPGEPGKIYYRPGGFMAAADEIRIELRGRQTHAALPWNGVDVISLGAAIVGELNTITARTVDVTAHPTVLTIATINAGVRFNIIPETLNMTGTLRTFDREQRQAVIERINATVNALASAYGADAEVQIIAGGALTYNDPALAGWAMGPLAEAAGEGRVDSNRPPITTSEDFSAFGAVAPSLFYHMGASADGVDPATSPPNHSPYFDVNEAVLPVGVRAHVLVALRYLETHSH